MSGSLIDRLMKPVRPSLIPSFTPPAREIDRGLWRVERRLRMPGGLILPIGMTIFRLPSGKLFVHSPAPLDAELERWIRATGPVAALLAPNSFHILVAHGDPLESDAKRAFALAYARYLG